MPSLDDIYLRTLQVKQLIIGPVIKQYGPFRLHKLTYVLRSGRLLDASRYFVVAGELVVPLTVSYGGGSDNPQGYTKIVRRRRGPFRDCVHVADISISKSTNHDLYDAVDYWMKFKQATLTGYSEQLAIADDASTRHLRRAVFYQKNLAEIEAELAIVSEAFRAFLLEYPDAAVGTKRNAARVAWEAQRLRKKMQRGAWVINKILK